MTFSGVKGTVSITTILLIPSDIEQEYPILIFLVASVTLLTFLTAILLLPHLADEQEESKDYLMHIGILNEVALELEKSWKVQEINFPFMQLLTITMDVLKI